VTGVREGDLCSVVSGERFRVAKILREDERAVHVRLYAETFWSRPVAVDPEKLTLGGILDDAYGIGHVPLARDEFERWEPVVIEHGTVDPEELEGYELWAEAEAARGAGLWGAAEPSLVDRIRALLSAARRPR
jgi:hypothetical protein